MGMEFLGPVHGSSSALPTSTPSFDIVMVEYSVEPIARHWASASKACKAARARRANLPEVAENIVDRYARGGLREMVFRCLVMRGEGMRN